MTKNVAVFLTALLLSLAAWPLCAQTDFPQPNWSRPMAFEAAGTVDSQSALKTLFRLAREGKDEPLLQALASISQREDWPLPAREHVIHAFASGLGDLPPRRDITATLDYLLGYESLTLVPHEEHATAGVPLFNIRAATVGSLGEWERRSAEEVSLNRLQQGSEAWLDGWADAGKARRKGYIDSLQFATSGQLSELGAAAISRVPNNPPVAEIAARAGLLLADLQLFSHAVSAGSGAWIAPAFRQASKIFGDNENLLLLQYSMELAPEGTAALAMAELAPARLDQHDVAELMFRSLDHPKLGSAAALVLSRSSEPWVRARLERVAAGEDGKLASQRAGLALDMPPEQPPSRSGRGAQ